MNCFDQYGQSVGDSKSEVQAPIKMIAEAGPTEKT
jgi:hypothetical protein